MMVEQAFRTMINIPGDRTLDWMRSFQDEVSKLDGVRSSLELRSGKMDITVGRPKQLSNAPRGAHEFAYGWIMALNIQYLTEWFGHDIHWTDIDVVDGRVEVHPDGDFVSSTIVPRSAITGMPLPAENLR